MRIDHLVVVITGLVAGTLGAWVSLQEANQFFYSGLDGEGQLEKLVDGSLVAGLSSDARQAYAETCLVSVPRLEARFLPQDQAKGLVEACKERVGALAEASPVNSFLWFARARLAYNALDWADLNRSLVLSRASGPYEYWLAARRFLLAERAFAQLEPETVTQFEQEVVMLAQSTQGSRLLAAEYILVRDFRPRVTAILDALSDPVKGEFLENVKAFVGQRGGKL